MGRNEGGHCGEGYMGRGEGRGRKVGEGGKGEEEEGERKHMSLRHVSSVKRRGVLQCRQRHVQQKRAAQKRNIPPPLLSSSSSALSFPALPLVIALQDIKKMYGHSVQQKGKRHVSYVSDLHNSNAYMSYLCK